MSGSLIVNVFNKDQDEASHLMYTVHFNAYAVCGTYAKEIAETKREKVMTAARQEGFPLLCTIEAE